MDTLTLWLVLLLMATLMSTLAWVGLRFFCPSGIPAPHPSPASRTRWRLPRPQAPPLSALLAPLRSRQSLWLAASLLLVGFTVTVTLTLSSYINPPAITGGDMGPTATVSNVLGEEVLVPPQPLPPSMFIGTECFDLEHADRDWSKLDGRFRNAILQLFVKMEVRGYKMALLEGYRSPERQDMLASKGPSVTHARGGQSKHQHGFAADMAPVREGHLRISERDPWAASAYQALGEEAGKLGLAWGGSWAMRDLGHVELAAKLSQLTIQPSS